ncbi:MAG TPA: hypothetical protein VMB50_18960 [Myxococcales bacterium]|nr:hypothetical protein [Myxococcales bacterium]
MTAHLSLLELDALAEAGTPPAHLAECPRCQAELEALRTDEARFRTEVYGRTLAQVQRRLSWRRRLSLAPLLLAPALGLAAILLVPRRTPEPEVGVKGVPTLRLFVSHAGEVTQARDGAALEAGDELRFEVQPGGLPFLILGAVDSSGQASIIYPMDGSRSVQINPQAAFVPPGSAVLDSTTGPERVFAILSRKPIPAEGLLAAMRSLGAAGPQALRTTRTLPGVPAEAQLSFLWEKTVR